MAEYKDDLCLLFNTSQRLHLDGALWSFNRQFMWSLNDEKGTVSLKQIMVLNFRSSRSVRLMSIGQSNVSSAVLSLVH